MVKNQGAKQRVQRILGDCWQWETNGQCVKGNNCSFRHDMDKRGKSSPSNLSPNSFMQQNERKPSRTRSPRGKSPSGRMSRWPYKDYLRGTCNNSFCERWQPPECLYYKTKSGCRFGEKCLFAHRQVDEQPTKMSKSNNDRGGVALLKRVIGMNEDSLPTDVTIDQGKTTKDIDAVPSNVQSARQEALLYVFEDNEAVINMIIKRKESYNETHGTLQNAFSTRPRVVVGLVRSAYMHTVRLMNSRRNGPNRIMTKVLWLC